MASNQQPQGKLTRQQLYQRIRETSKDEYILSEMIRLGFWPGNTDKPTLTEAFVKERAALLKRLQELGKEQHLYSDPEKALQELHKQRKKEAREKREQKRKERNQARFERARNWYEKQQREITYLGERVSAGLAGRENDNQRLGAQRLPQFENALGLAEAMGITLNELRFLTYQKDVSPICHYRAFEILKKTGGTRKISAPMPRMKRAQYWILENILQPLALHDAAHGFVPQRNIVTNARPHLGKAVVINLDLRDFFPTISYPRVKGVFKNLGYSEQLSTLFGLLTTEAETTSLELDGQRWFVQQGQRFLPQGAPTSPALSNLICRRLDKRLESMAEKLGFRYTRYADDLTFSSPAVDDKKIQQLLWRCKSIIKDEGFTVHPDKTRIMRRHQRQEVTGIVVNEKPSVDRATLKRFRALLHQIDKYGPQGKTWGTGQLFNSIDGYANYVAMVNPEKGIALQKAVAHLKRKYNFTVKPGRVLALNKKLLRLKAAAGQVPRESWWQALPPLAPQLERTTVEVEEQKQALRKAEKTPAQTAEPPREELVPSARGRASARPAAEPGAKGTTHIGWIMFGLGLIVLIILSLLGN